MVRTINGEGYADAEEGGGEGGREGGDIADSAPSASRTAWTKVQGVRPTVGKIKGSHFRFGKTPEFAPPTTPTPSRRVCVCCGAVLLQGQCATVCYNVSQCIAVCCSLLQFAALRCNVLQCVAVCYSALQCVVLPCSNAVSDEETTGTMCVFSSNIRSLLKTRPIMITIF